MTFEHFEAEPDPGHFGIRVVDARWHTFAHFRGRLRILAHFAALWRTLAHFGGERPMSAREHPGVPGSALDKSI